MKKTTLFILIFIPFLLIAQKGEIKPDKTSVEKKTPFPVDIKIWTIEEYLLNCPDSLNKCYVIKENNITKKIPQEDVYDFPYEENYKYTVWVREELKTPPINPKSGIYNYILVKIISKKLIIKKTKPAISSSDITEKKPSSKIIDSLQNTINLKPQKDTVIKTLPVAVSKNELVKNTTDKPISVKPAEATKIAQSNADALLREDVELLKKQVRELQKQVDVMKIINDMQMQLLQKKQ